MSMCQDLWLTVSFVTPVISCRSWASRRTELLKLMCLRRGGGFERIAESWVGRDSGQESNDGTVIKILVCGSQCRLGDATQNEEGEYSTPNINIY